MRAEEGMEAEVEVEKRSDASTLNLSFNLLRAGGRFHHPVRRRHQGHALVPGAAT